MKCLVGQIAFGEPFFKAGEDYDLKQVGTIGRFTVYEHARDGAIYRFGLDENGELEMDGYRFKFEVNS